MNRSLQELYNKAVTTWYQSRAVGQGCKQWREMGENVEVRSVWIFRSFTKRLYIRNIIWKNESKWKVQELQEHEQFNKAVNTTSSEAYCWADAAMKIRSHSYIQLVINQWIVCQKWCVTLLTLKLYWVCLSKFQLSSDVMFDLISAYFCFMTIIPSALLRAPTQKERFVQFC